MNHFPILQELFESDSVIFMVIGLVLGRFIGMKLKAPKKNIIGAVICGVIYGLCEVLTGRNVPASYMTGMILLFVGTVALGGCVGFIVSAVIEKVRCKGENHDT